MQEGSSDFDRWRGDCNVRHDELSAKKVEDEDSKWTGI